jgi:hypothetical protein
MKLIKLHRLSSVECVDDFEGLWSCLSIVGGKSGNMKKAIKNATVWLLFGGMA